MTSKSKWLLSSDYLDNLVKFHDDWFTEAAVPLMAVPITNNLQCMLLLWTAMSLRLADVGSHVCWRHQCDVEQSVISKILSEQG